MIANKFNPAGHFNHDLPNRNNQNNITKSTGAIPKRRNSTMTGRFEGDSNRMVNIDDNIVASVPSSSRYAALVEIFRHKFYGTEEPTVESCICERPSSTIFCTGCEKFAFGRIGKSCRCHSNKFYLQDWRKCIHCGASAYMMREIDLKYSTILKIKAEDSKEETRKLAL